MKKTWTHQFVILGIGVIAILGMSGQAIAAGILPLKTDGSNNLIQPLTLNTAPPITVSITDASNNDITATWLPEPGQRVNIVVKDASGNPISAIISLVQPVAGNLPFANPLAPTTSSYPGTCTNTTLATNVEPDFSLSGNQLTANDCGGMAVLNITAGVSTYKVIVPQDSNFNLIPDVWENKYGGNLTANADTDTGSGTQIGDGISNFDEYRGFMVSGVHIRTDPRQKDLFVHPVNPQCGTNSQSLMGGGTKTYDSGTSLFTNLNTLISGTQIHVIGYTPNATNYQTTEWVDLFNNFSVANGIVWNSGGSTTQTEPQADRRINSNAVYPIVDAKTGLPIQKGLRIIECVDASMSSPLGVASLGSPNGGDNALIYTQRIVNYLDNSLGASSGTLSYATYNQSGVVGAVVSITHDALVAKTYEFILAMEVGHSVSLTPTVEGTKSTSYGYHHAPGTGSNLDQAITNKLSTKTGNTFYIPSFYNSADQSNFKLNN